MYLLVHENNMRLELRACEASSGFFPGCLMDRLLEKHIGASTLATWRRSDPGARPFASRQKTLNRARFFAHLSRQTKSVIPPDSCIMDFLWQ